MSEIPLHATLTEAVSAEDVLTTLALQRVCTTRLGK
jgi:hypothetical protein